MTKELLFSIINELHDIGYDTVAIVNDMGPSNIGLWRDLNISITNSSFEHPYPEKNPCFFRCSSFNETFKKSFT